MAGRRFGAPLCVTLFAAVAISGHIVEAQDTRQIVEPKIPPSCVQLRAQLRAEIGRAHV